MIQIKDNATGKIIKCHPVDVKDILERGLGELIAPVTAEDAPVVAAVAAPPEEGKDAEAAAPIKKKPRLRRKASSDKAESDE